MENIIIDLIKITLVVSFIIDISGITISIKKLLWKKLMGKKIPFTNNFDIPLIECSLCVTFWSVLIYSIYTGQPLLNSLLYAVLCAYFVRYITIIYRTMIDLFQTLISKINKYE